MAYALFTKAFGVSYAGAEVTIRRTSVGTPATILSGPSGGLVNDRGQATLDASGNLSVYIDTAFTWDVALNDKTPATISTAQIKSDPSVGISIVDKNGVTISQSPGASIPMLSAAQTSIGQTVVVQTPAQVKAGGEPVMIKEGRLIDGKGNVHAPIQRAGGTLNRSKAAYTIWFNFSDRGNSLQLDATGTLQANIKGGSTGRWTSAPGLTFNGSNTRMECNQADSNAPQYSSLVAPSLNGFTNAVLACSNLASLVTEGDMIIAWAVISHSNAGWATDQTLFSFGMAADPLNQGGWGIGIKAGLAGVGSAGKLTFQHRPVGATSLDKAAVSSDSILGANSVTVANNNTRTAFCFEISAHQGVPGLLEIRSSQFTLDFDGGRAQNNVGCVTPSATINGGTSACGRNVTSPLTIGAFCNSTPISYLAPAGQINPGTNGALVLSGSFGATGKVTTPYSNGIWMWFGAVPTTTPALTAKYYWVVFSSLTQGTIYSNGPGSSPITFTHASGVVYTTPSADFINNFAGAITQIGIERRPLDFGLSMQVARDLRANQNAFPACLE